MKKSYDLTLHAIATDRVLMGLCNSKATLCVSLSPAEKDALGRYLQNKVDRRHVIHAFEIVEIEKPMNYGQIMKELRSTFVERGAAAR